VSNELVEEYLELLRRLNVEEARVSRFEERLRKRRTVGWVNLGPRPLESRDPDDNLLLATAVAGRAKFLVTNDHDLLDIPAEGRRTFRFEIVTPADLLARVAQ
jgi:putative PIN family toxin of toxin-antitoxin system